MTKSVTFIGLGTMGQPMVRNLARSLPVAVYDANPDAIEAATRHNGVTPLPSLIDGVGADIVILMLPNSTVVERVLGDPSAPESFAARLRPGTLVVDMGSSAPQATQALAERLRERKVAMVDAPVSGGPRKAATAELTIMVGGPVGDYERALPLLRAMGASVTHVGPAGSAHALKALNNLLSAIGLVGALEVLTAGAKFGLDPRTMLDVINRSTGRNQSTEVKIGPEVLDGRFKVGFSLPLTVKDINTALDLTTSLGLSPEVSRACVRFCRAALADLGQETNPDQSEMARYLAKATGVDLTR
jgi:3-hydroxyisobutyrate dehydrogenase